MNKNDVAESRKVYRKTKKLPDNAIGLTTASGGLSPTSFTTTTLGLSGPNTIDLLGPISSSNTGTVTVDYGTRVNQKYDYLMNTPNAELFALGYFVTTDNGSIFQGTTEAAKVYLPIQDIQYVENNRGTPGALLLKLQQPAIAKDTAGYEGGTSGTFNGQPPVYEPIPEVQVLPPVVQQPDGTVDFDPTVVPVIDPMPTGNTGIVPPTQQSMLGGKYYWLWYVAAIIVVILYLKFRK